MSATVVIYRKGNNAPKVDAATIADVRKVIGVKCRVQRPEIMALFLPIRGGAKSTFYKLPELSPQLIDNSWRRQTDYADAGWEVPVNSLGRVGEATPSAAQSVLLWIKQNLADVVNPADVSVVLEER